MERYYGGFWLLDREEGVATEEDKEENWSSLC